jgi:hypothetical protein
VRRGPHPAHVSGLSRFPHLPASRHEPHIQARGEGTFVALRSGSIGAAILRLRVSGLVLTAHPPQDYINPYGASSALGAMSRL